MKNRGVNFIVFFLWISMLIYFFNLDVEAFVLFLLLPPVIGVLLYFALRTGYFVLTLFFALAFIGTAITPAFFFLNKDSYSYSGFSAIKDFKFDIYEFLNIYGYLYLMLLLILVFTISLNKISFKQHSKKNSQRINSRNLISYNIFGEDLAMKKKIISNNRFYSIYLVVFILAILIPLNITMYLNGIGISTVEAPDKPFKVVGISIYFRNYIALCIITYLYFKSNRSKGIAFIILLYAAVIGVFSLSKGNVVLTCLPVLLFALLDRNIARLIFSCFYLLTLYGVVSWARQFISLAGVGSFEVIRLIFNGFSIESLNEFLNLISVLGDVTTRLYGANVIVLAHKFNLNNNFLEITNFYLNKSENLSLIILNDVFELTKPEGVDFGVGMGYLGTLILLANKNLFFLLILSFITAIYLSVSEVIVNKYTRSTNLFAPVGYALGFFMIFFLYDANMAHYYSVLTISIIGLFLVFLNKKIKSVILYRRGENDLNE